MSAKRLIVKAISYKGLTTVFLFTMAYIRFGNIKTALIIGIGDAMIKMCLYSIHEWLWIRFGHVQAGPHVMLEHVTLEAVQEFVDRLPAEQRAKLNLNVEI